MTKPFILGLTGSIGMGKSAVAAMLGELGVPVFDADAAVHELQGPNGALLAPIERAFPGSTGAQGVDRQKLGAAVFGHPEKLRLLEGIVHPEVAEMRRAFLADNAAAPQRVRSRDRQNDAEGARQGPPASGKPLAPFD